MITMDVEAATKLAQMARDREKYQGIILKLRKFLNHEVRWWIPDEHRMCDSTCSHKAQEEEMLEKLDQILEETRVDPWRRGMEEMHL